MGFTARLKGGYHLRMQRRRAANLPWSRAGA